MYMLRLSKLINPLLGSGFSKIKPVQLGTKLTTPGLKPAPILKKPNINPLTPKLIEKTLEKAIKTSESEETSKQEEAPVIKQKHAVVTIMGHVDHGKTTLIDFLRKSQIAQNQDGGITQRIGAFRINCLGQRITFIDTPGHQAFVNMRQRGASVTDLVVLIVSAVEGVKKQTLEVIELIKRMQVPVIVAINKIDLPEANPEQVQAQLEKAGLKLQLNGGEIPVVHISAKNGVNVDLLCELIIDETKNATAIFNGLAYASVLQANQTKQGLNAMTIIVEKGVLKQNAILIIGKESFRAKTILDDRGENLKQAFPGDAVQIVGIPFVPAPGDIVFEVENQKKARFTLQKNKQKSYEQERLTKKAQGKDVTATKIHFQKGRQGRRQKRAFCRGVRQVWMNKFADEQQKILTKIQQLKKQQGNQIIDEAIIQLQIELEAHKKYVYQYLRNTGDSPDTLNFIIKFGDRGMEETILLQLEKLKSSIEQQTKVKLNLIKTDVGDVTVGDIQEAQNCSAKIFTFGASISSEANSHLEGFEQPRCHKLIHNLLKDIKETSFNKKLSTIKGVERGKCEVAEIYTIKLKKKQSVIPGVKVTVGKITKKCKAYIFRNGIPISSPLDISFIKSFKKQMLELKKGEQGTIGFMQQTPNLQKGDQLAFYQQF